MADNFDTTTLAGAVLVMLFRSEEEAAAPRRLDYRDDALTASTMNGRRAFLLIRKKAHLSNDARCRSTVQADQHHQQVQAVGRDVRRNEGGFGRRSRSSLGGDGAGRHRYRCRAAVPATLRVRTTGRSRTAVTRRGTRISSSSGTLLPRFPRQPSTAEHYTLLPPAITGNRRRLRRQARLLRHRI